MKDDLISSSDQADLLNSTYQNPTTLSHEPFIWSDQFIYTWGPCPNDSGGGSSSSGDEGGSDYNLVANTKKSNSFELLFFDLYYFIQSK